MQSDFDGVSMRYSFDDASADGARKTQFYSMLGSRSIWHEGWKAVTTHPTIAGWSHFNDDTWELYHTDVDRSELHDLSKEDPDKLRELQNLWFAEAGRNGAFPLDDRSALEIILTPRPLLSPPRNRYTYFPDTAEVPEPQAVNVRNRSFAIGALVDIPAPGAEGVLFAQGARFGGHALYIKDNRLHYVNSFAGMVEQKIDATEGLPTGADLILSASFEKDGEDPPGVATGILSLYYGDKKVGEGRIKNLAAAGERAIRDSDELTDGDEVLRRGTDPRNADTDGDKLKDGEEVRLGSDPRKADTDNDGLGDADEVARGTSPVNPDTDGDSLIDGDEVKIGTNPLNSDTDNDRRIDSAESVNCPNYFNPNSDGDGIIDGLDLDPCDPRNPSLTATINAAITPVPPTLPPTSPTTQPPPNPPTSAPTGFPLPGIILFRVEPGRELRNLHQQSGQWQPDPHNEQSCDR